MVVLGLSSKGSYLLSFLGSFGITEGAVGAARVARECASCTPCMLKVVILVFQFLIERISTAFIIYSRRLINVQWLKRIGLFTVFFPVFFVGFFINLQFLY